jgi:mannitol-1-phosphate 5-dehydrogenase
VSAPHCLLIGAGRVAGGFVAPLLCDAGWEITLVSRNRRIVEAINEGAGIWVRRVGDIPVDRWVAGISAVLLRDPRLPRLVAGADLLATAVGPSGLAATGRALARPLRARLAASEVPVNLITFENHRRAPEILAASLLAEDTSLARKICQQVGIGGAVVWRTISRRVVTDAGLRFDTDGVGECYADAMALNSSAAPLDGSIPGIEPVRGFDDRMVEKLWLFNTGHAAAAYLGWQAGSATVDKAMSDAAICKIVAGVVNETQQAFEAYLNTRPGSAQIPSRPAHSMLARYANPALKDLVARVAREPRRKLAADDRFVGPSTMCLAAGVHPVALAEAMAAALSYGAAADPQAVDLQREIELLGPRNVLAEVSDLDPQDELVQLIYDRYVRQNITGYQSANGTGRRFSPPRSAWGSWSRGKGIGVGVYRRT